MDSLFILFLLSTNPTVDQFTTHFEVDSVYAYQEDITVIQGYDPGNFISISSAFIKIDEIEYEGELFLTRGKDRKGGIIHFTSYDEELHKLLKDRFDRTAVRIIPESNVFIPADDRSTAYRFGARSRLFNGVNYKFSASLRTNVVTGEHTVLLYVRYRFSPF